METNREKVILTTNRKELEKETATERETERKTER